MFSILNSNLATHQYDNVFNTVNFVTRSTAGSFVQANTMTSGILNNLTAEQAAVEFAKSGTYLLCYKFTNNSSSAVSINLFKKNTAADAYEAWTTCKLPPSASNDFVSPVLASSGGRVYATLASDVSVSLYMYFVYLG